MFRGFFSAALILVLLGCGGGGGGGGGGGSSYSVELSTRTVQFEGNWDAADPSQKEVIASAKFNGDGLVVGYPPGIEKPGWLAVDVESSGGGTAKVIFRRGFAAVGTHKTTVRFVTGKADGSSVAYSDVNVTFIARENVILKKATTHEPVVAGVVFSQDAMSSAQFEVIASSARWKADVSHPELEAVPSEGVGQGLFNPTTIKIRKKPSVKPTAAGPHRVKLTVRTGDGSDSAETEILYGIDEARVWAMRPKLMFFSSPGKSQPLAKSITLQTNLEGANHQYVAISNSAWVETEISGDKLQVKVNPNQLAVGTHVGEVKLQLRDTVVSSETETLKIHLTKADTDLPEERIIPLTRGGSVALHPYDPELYILERNDFRKINIHTGKTVETWPAPELDAAVGLWRFFEDGYYLATYGAWRFNLQEKKWFTGNSPQNWVWCDGLSAFDTKPTYELFKYYMLDTLDTEEFYGSAPYAPNNRTNVLTLGRRLVERRCYRHAKVMTVKQLANLYTPERREMQLLNGTETLGWLSSDGQDPLPGKLFRYSPAGGLQWLPTPTVTVGNETKELANIYQASIDAYGRIYGQIISVGAGAAIGGYGRLTSDFKFEKRYGSRISGDGELLIEVRETPGSSQYEARIFLAK